MTTQRVVLEITTSLDGFVAGPDAGFEHPLGIGGMQIHEWAFATRAFCEHHGMPGGEAGPDSEVIEAHLAAVGATIMGRRMFSGGSGPWDGDPNASGWWGDEPPFRHPVFVLTHHAREPLELGGGTTFTFVTGGVEQALELARVAAGDKNVAVSGGASVAQQFVTRGLLDDLQIHVVPLLLGGGVQLFGSLEIDPVRLETTWVVASPTVTHLRFAMPKSARDG